MEDVLQEAGLSKNEAVIYLKLSEIGTSSAYRLAKEAKLFKANTYDTIKRLVEKGLVSQKIIEGKVLYEAADPAILINLVETKKEKLYELLPRIRLMQSSVISQSSVNIYKGSEALKNIFYHILEFNEDFLIYGAPKEAYSMLRHWIEGFHKERVQRKIKMYHIYNFDASERIHVLIKMPYTLVRCLPELYDSRVSTHVCGDEVFLVSFIPSIKIIHIKDNDIAKAYKNYYWILWQNAKKIVK